MRWWSTLVPTFDAPYLASVLGIILIDLVLAGDNAVVIAMAVKNLPPARRRQGILLGAAAAVALRLAATFFVSQLLAVGLLKLAGGAAIVWIGVKLFLEGAGGESSASEVTSLWHAVRLIVVADITLSLDNVLAVGGAALGDGFLVLFGLLVSVPFVVLTSNVLSMLMDRLPILVALGAAVLGKVGTEMMLTDPWVARVARPGPTALHVLGGAGAAGVLLAGWWLRRRAARGLDTGEPAGVSPAEAN